MISFPKKVWVNGRLLPGARPAISAFDRGFLHGDGVYETLRVYGGRMFHFDQHFQRLESSARGLRLNIPYARPQVRAAVEKTLRANGLREAVVRWTLTRGPGPRGYDPEPCTRPTFVIAAWATQGHPPYCYKEGVTASIVRVRRNPKSALDPFFKTTNNLNNALAYWEAREKKSYEGILLNTEGHLTEGSSSNVFFISGEVLKTPSLDCGLLNGVTRAAVIELAKIRRLTVAEGRYRPRDLLSAQEVFLTGTTLEVMPVTKIINEQGRVHAIGTGQVGAWAPLLRHDYRCLVAREINDPGFMP